MLELAIKLAREGRAVYVMFDSIDICRCIERQRLREMVGDGPPVRIKFETPDTLVNFNWQTMTLRGAHPNCVVLVDHSTIERRYGRMLEALTQFDEGSEGGGRI
jgi:hypothetical protein